MQEPFLAEWRAVLGGGSPDTGRGGRELRFGACCPRDGVTLTFNVGTQSVRLQAEERVFPVPASAPFGLDGPSRLRLYELLRGHETVRRLVFGKGGNAEDIVGYGYAILEAEGPWAAVRDLWARFVFVHRIAAYGDLVEGSPPPPPDIQAALHAQQHRAH